MLDLVCREVLLVARGKVYLAHLEDVLNLILQEVGWHVD